jgi:hypothetical protein
MGVGLPGVPVGVDFRVGVCVDVDVGVGVEVRVGEAVPVEVGDGVEVGVGVREDVGVGAEGTVPAWDGATGAGGATSAPRMSRLQAADSENSAQRTRSRLFIIHP